MWKMTFQILPESRAFETFCMRTNGFHEGVWGIEKKCWGTKLLISKRSTNFLLTIFIIGVIFLLLYIKNDFVEIKNFIFPPKYTRCGKKVKKQNYSFIKYLQIFYWLFFHRCYIFSFIYQKRFYRNKTLHFPAKINEMRKKDEKQNYSFIKYLQICYWLFFHTCYIFSFIYQKRFYRNKKISFSRQNKRDTGKMLEIKIICFNKIYNFGCNYFFIGIKKIVFQYI